MTVHTQRLLSLLHHILSNTLGCPPSGAAQSTSAREVLGVKGAWLPGNVLGCLYVLSLHCPRTQIAASCLGQAPSPQSYRRSQRRKSHHGRLASQLHVSAVTHHVATLWEGLFAVTQLIRSQKLPAKCNPSLLVPPTSYRGKTNKSKECLSTGVQCWAPQ
ncbi:hypothetical protein XELAEV_18031070mg [Xenopus laevis]|uniref:Secreted protein n=1 Tax=Xenopus laevis TaxID=8355 RepID=A0A974CNK6_XENLA|nr:hypothetical protein XELAEV_18031070mg [Xenopus laevis]